MVVSAARLAQTAAPPLRPRSVRMQWARDVRQTRRTSGRPGRRAEHRSVWRRFGDDRDLVRLKLLLLAGLVVLTALLERGV